MAILIVRAISNIPKPRYADPQHGGTNVFVERLWRTVKYEEVYLHAYDSASAAGTGIDRHLNWYNAARPHSSQEKQTPSEAYAARLPAVKLAA